MHSLTYRSGSNCQTINLDCLSLRVGQLGPLRGRSWQYTLAAHHAISRTRVAKEIELELTSQDLDKLTEFINLADDDFNSQDDGILTVNGEWFQRVAIPTDETNGIYNPRLQQVKLHVILLEGRWRRETLVSVQPVDASAMSTTYFDFNVDYPFDYTLLKDTSTRLNNGSQVAQPVGITIYGYALNPYITIDRNTYSVDVTVAEGSRLEIDPIQSTVTLIDSGGRKTNVAANAERGTGEGSGKYIFHKIRPGSKTVSWPNSFSFDLHQYEERTALPWNSLD